jgi:hypothetical protein
MSQNYPVIALTYTDQWNYRSSFIIVMRTYCYRFYCDILNWVEPLPYEWKVAALSLNRVDSLWRFLRPPLFHRVRLLLATV